MSFLGQCGISEPVMAMSSCYWSEGYYFDIITQCLLLFANRRYSILVNMIISITRITKCKQFTDCRGLQLALWHALMTHNKCTVCHLNAMMHAYIIWVTMIIIVTYIAKCKHFTYCGLQLALWCALVTDGKCIACHLNTVIHALQLGSSEFDQLYEPLMALNIVFVLTCH